MIFIYRMKNTIIKFALKSLITFQVLGLTLGVSLITLELLEREDLIRRVISIVL
jgi:hypothetical protein